MTFLLPCELYAVMNPLPPPAAEEEKTDRIPASRLPSQYSEQYLFERFFHAPQSITNFDTYIKNILGMNPLLSKGIPRGNYSDENCK